MNGCVYKTIDGKCLKYSSETTVSYCVDIPTEHISVSCEGRNLTNADRIRAMSDEELANWIYNATTNALSILQIGSDAPTQNYFDWLNWLKRKVENK